MEQRGKAWRTRFNEFEKEFPAALEFLSGPLVMYPNDYYSKNGPEGMALKPGHRPVSGHEC